MTLAFQPLELNTYYISPENHCLIYDNKAGINAQALLDEARYTKTLELLANENIH